MYKLADCVEINREHPTTFEIPSDEEKSKVKVGDFVKLNFLYNKQVPIPNQAGHTCSAERMWVQVTGIEDGQYKGEINNTPLNTDLQEKMVVDFELKHVCSIEFNNKS